MEPSSSLTQSSSFIPCLCSVPSAHSLENKQCPITLSFPFNHFTSLAHVSSKSQRALLLNYMYYLLYNKLLEGIITYGVFWLLLCLKQYPGLVGGNKTLLRMMMMMLITIRMWY